MKKWVRKLKSGEKSEHFDGTYLYEKCVGLANMSDVGQFDRSSDRHKVYSFLMSVVKRPTHFFLILGMIGRYKANRPTEKVIGRKTTDIFLKNFAHLCRLIWLVAKSRPLFQFSGRLIVDHCFILPPKMKGFFSYLEMYGT